MWPRCSLVFAGLVLAVLSPRAVSAGDELLCAIPPVSYAAAKAKNPDMAFAIGEIEKLATATWYSDRIVNGDYALTAKQLVATCPESSRLTVVVYGLPFKDCEAQESMVGSRNQDSTMYQSFVSNLQQTVGNRKALYVIEPDAIALLARGGCAKFRSATSDLNLHCIIGTSRNYNGPSSQDEWCNYKNAAMGELPTGSTGDPNIDYFVWLKTVGESDGTCAGRTPDATPGPGAGEFFPDFMKQLWNNGALVKKRGLPVIDGTVTQVETLPPPSNTSSPPQSSTTPPPTSSPSPSAADSPQQTPSNASLESRSIDDAGPTPAPSPSSSPSGPTPARDVAGRVVAAPLEQEPVFTNTPAPPTTAPSAEAPAGDVREATTRSSGGKTMSAGLIALVCLVGVALIALVAFVAMRVRERSLEEHKSPLDPRIHYLGDSPGEAML